MNNTKLYRVKAGNQLIVWRNPNSTEIIDSGGLVVILKEISLGSYPEGNLIFTSLGLGIIYVSQIKDRLEEVMVADNTTMQLR